MSKNSSLPLKPGVTGRRAPPRLCDIRDAKTLDQYLRLALEEDGAWDDATSDSLIHEKARGAATMISKAKGVFCGGAIAARVFRIRDPRLRARALRKEGAPIAAGDRLLRIEGPLRPILAAERTALNFAQRLSGIATLTRQFVASLDGRPTQVLDTRKTTPLWRALERHAVRCGGGFNHRFALDDKIMIKNNHADATGGVGESVRLARTRRPDLEVAAEARTLEEVREAIAAGADIVMLDNMKLPQIRVAVRWIAGRALTEVTGGVNLSNASRLAGAGVDRISVGALTHSAPALDLALRLDPPRAPKDRLRKKP